MDGASGQSQRWQGQRSQFPWEQEAQLSADLFGPVARDNLESFFRVALARDVSDRFSSLQDMTRTWTDAFRDLETVPPLTTSATEDGDGHAAAADDERTGTSREPGQDRAAARVKRAEASRSAIPSTPLAATGLSPYALSAALQKLNVSTAGELAAIPAAKITRLRGIGFPHRAVTSPWLVAEVPASPDRHTGERHLHVDHVYVATAERSRPMGHAEHEVRWFTPADISTAPDVSEDSRTLATRLLALAAPQPGPGFQWPPETGRGPRPDDQPAGPPKPPLRAPQAIPRNLRG